MKKVIVAILVFAATSAMAQMNLGTSDINAFRTIHADKAHLVNFSVPESLIGNVQIELISVDSSAPPIPLNCGAMYFEYTEGELSSIRFEDGIELNHPDVSLIAGRATIDFATNLLTLFDNPKVKVAGGKDVKGDKITVSLETGELGIDGFKSDIIPFFVNTDAAKLTEDDIKDWTALLTQLQNQANAESPSPGKHLVGLLDENLQQVIKKVDVATLVDPSNRKDLVGKLNGLLERSDFYDEASWNGVAISEDIKDTLENYPPSVKSQLKDVNRALLEAAFPEAF